MDELKKKLNGIGMIISDNKSVIARFKMNKMKDLVVTYRRDNTFQITLL